MTEPFESILGVVVFLLMSGVFFVLPVFWLSRKLYDPIQRLLPPRLRHAFHLGARLPVVVAAVIWLIALATIFAIADLVAPAP